MPRLKEKRFAPLARVGLIDSINRRAQNAIISGLERRVSKEWGKNLAPVKKQSPRRGLTIRMALGEGNTGKRKRKSWSPLKRGGGVQAG